MSFGSSLFLPYPYPHEVDEGLVNPWDENIPKQGDHKVMYAYRPWTRPPIDQQDEGRGEPELEE